MMQGLEKYKFKTDLDAQVALCLENERDDSNSIKRVYLIAKIVNSEFGLIPRYSWFVDDMLVSNEETETFTLSIDQHKDKTIRCQVFFDGYDKKFNDTFKVEEKIFFENEKLTLTIGEHEGKKVVWAEIGGERLSKEAYSCSWSAKKADGKTITIYYKGVHLELADLHTGDIILCEAKNNASLDTLTGSILLKESDFSTVILDALPPPEPASEPVSELTSESKPSGYSGFFTVEKPTEVTAPKFRCFDSNLGRLHYLIANRNDCYATNTFQYLDYCAFLHLLLKEQGYKRVVIVSHKSENQGENFPVIAYDMVSEITFNEDFLPKYKEYQDTHTSVDNQAFIAEYSKLKEANSNKIKPDLRAGMGGKKTADKEKVTPILRFGRRVIRTVIPETPTFNENDKKLITFKAFSEYLVVPALEQKVIKTAIVLPLEMLQREDFLNSLVSSNLRDQISSVGDNIILVTAEQESALIKLFDIREYEKIEDKLFDAISLLEKAETPMSRSDVIVRELSAKGRILIAASAPGTDEIANLLIAQKMEQPDKFDKLPYSKIYALADFISSKCNSTEKTKAALPKVDNNTWYVGRLADLENALRNHDVLDALLSETESLWDRTICSCSNLKATYVERVYAGPVRFENSSNAVMPLRRSQISEAERAHENDAAMQELNELIGLASVKELLKKRFSEARYNKSTEPGHYIFAGNPGTGKTVVARLMGEILHSQGLLAKGHVVEVQKADLVSNHVGETALKTRAKCEEALDGVLFLDEAYQLVNTDESTSEKFQSAFDREAYTELMSFMENNRKRLCVICAGYPFEMDLFRSANLGMPRRIPEKNVILFPDYSPEELYEILQKMAKDESLILTDSFNVQAKTALQQMWEEKDKEFGNAGDVRSFLDECKGNASVRAAELNLPTLELTSADIPTRFIGEDLSSEERKQRQAESMKKLEEMVGLKNVKKQLKKIISNRAISKRSKKGPGHYIFAGNPGTGKTVVARTLGEILKAYGLLDKGHTVEVSKADLVAEYVGQTETKTKKQCRKALDGVLFVDEAYELVNTDSGGFSSDFDKESYTTIMKFMGDNASRVCVIFAGYKPEMELFKKANPGMERRITETIVFDDYSDAELIQILELAAEKEDDPPVKLTKEFLDATKLIIPQMRKSASNFGNAGEIIKYLKDCIGNAAVRIVDQGMIEETDRVELKKCDLPDKYTGIIGGYEDKDEDTPVDSSSAHFYLIPKSEIINLPNPYEGVDIHGIDFPGHCIGAVVRIENEYGTATAFVISSDGMAITCAHAVAFNKDLSKVATKELNVYFKTIGKQEKQYPYEIVNIKPDLDMALIKINADHPLPCLMLAPEERNIKFGEECLLYGFPDGRKGIMQFPGTISTEAEMGGDGELGSIYYFSGDAYPGDSGGPIIAKSDGCVIGILRGAIGPKDGTKHNFMKPISYFWKEFLE